MMSPATPTQMTTPDVAVQPAPGMGVMETPSPAPPAPLSPTGDAQQVPPEPIPISPASPVSAVAGPPPAAPPQASDLTELDSYLSSLDEISKVPAPPAAPPVAPPVPGERPVPTNEITMQCHSCGNNYTAEIAQYPALVTCPVCQTQGMIQG